MFLSKSSLDEGGLSQHHLSSDLQAAYLHIQKIVCATIYILGLARVGFKRIGQFPLDALAIQLLRVSHTSKGNLINFHLASILKCKNRSTP